MKIKIKLDETNGIGSLIDSEPFFLKGNDEMQIEFLTSGKHFLLADVRNGNDTVRQIIIRDNIMTVPQNLIKAGRLDIVVRTYTGTAVGWKYLCEPIVLMKSQEETFKAYSVFDEIKERLDSVDAKISAFEKSLNFRDIALENKMKGYTQSLQKQIDELWQTQEQ